MNRTLRQASAVSEATRIIRPTDGLGPAERLREAQFVAPMMRSALVSGCEQHGRGDHGCDYTSEGELPLFSVYHHRYSPGRVTVEDVHGNIAGTVGGFRAAISACRALGPGDDKEYSVAFGNAGGGTTTFTAPNYSSHASVRAFIGWRIRLVFIEDQHQTPTISFSTSNHVSGAGGDSSRAFTFAFEGTTPTREYQLIIPALIAGRIDAATVSGRWAPFPGYIAGAAVASRGIAGASTVSLTGLSADAGTAYLSWLHPDHKAMADAMDAVALGAVAL